MVGVAQLVRAAGCGPAGRGFKSRHSPHFFAQILGKKTWSLKRLRFMARSAASCSVSCASYGEAVLHFIKRLFRWSSSISFRYEALFRFTPQYEAFAPLILWENEKMRVGVIFCQSTRGIRIKSPKILCYKRSQDLCRRKKIGQSTLHLYVLLSLNGE